MEKDKSEAMVSRSGSRDRKHSRSRSKNRNRSRGDSKDKDRSRDVAKGTSKNNSRGHSRDRSKKRRGSKDRSHRRRSRDRRSGDRSHKHQSQRHEIRQKIIENDDKEIFRPDVKSPQEKQDPPAEKPKRQSKFDVKPPGLEDSMFENSSIIRNQQYEFELNPIKSLHARRVYVGGVGECTEKDVERFFNTMIQKAANKHIPCKPVVSVFLNREKRYAFVEFNSIEITTQIMGMNGIMFQGNPLKIRRPNDFQQSMLPPENPNAPKLDLRKIGLSNVEEVRDDYHTSKIIFTGVTEDISEKVLKDIFEPMGRLLRLQIFRNPYTLRTKGYGFCEYEDPVAADLFCTEFTEMDLGTSILRFKKATSEAINSFIKIDLPGEVSELEKEIEGKNKIPKQPTRILALHNIIPGMILGDPSLIEDYRNDIEEECKRHGRVIGMEFPPDVVDSIGYGTIFVEFEFIEECRQAFIQIYGRKYNERLIFCHYFDEIRYFLKDFKD